MKRVDTGLRRKAKSVFTLRRPAVVTMGFVLMMTLALMLSACQLAGDADIDRTALKAIVGEYQSVEKNVGKSGDEGFVGDWWRLSIQVKDAEAKKPHLSIYDNSAGNPGVEGRIRYIDGEKIIIEIDPDYYDELPSCLWKCDGKTLEVNYEIGEDGVVLTNNAMDIEFRKA